MNPAKASFCLRGVLLVVFSLSPLVTGEDADVVGGLCALWHHAAMVRGESIFIDGGVQTVRNNDTAWLGFSKYIYEIKVDRSWDNTTGVPIEVHERVAAEDPNPPNMLRGALFASSDPTKLFTFGGSSFLANRSDPDWKAPGQDSTSLWSFDTLMEGWQAYDTPSIPGRQNWGATAEDVDKNIGFVLNGQYDRGSSYGRYSTIDYEGDAVTNSSFNQIEYVDGMIMINLDTQETKNLSTETLGVPRVAGGLVWSQVRDDSKDGLLITFGGMQSSAQDVDTFTNGELVDLSTVSLCDNYNTENVTWFHQQTTGDVPSPRLDFCTYPWARNADDFSSINIYIHGGYNPNTSTLYDDVYVLSIPSFTWTKIYSGVEGRFGHTCNAAGYRTMLVTGGARDSSLYAIETTGQIQDLKSTTCNGGRLGVRLFDVTNATWTTYFDHDARGYQVPRKVVDVIGGSPNGGATMTKPEGGFAHPSIWTMFNSAPTINATATAPADNGVDSRLSGAGIAGAVVGSVAAMALIGVGIWLSLRRRSQKLRRHSIGTSAASELQGESARLEKDSYLCKPISNEPQELAGDNPEPQELAGDDLEPQDRSAMSGMNAEPSELQSRSVDDVGKGTLREAPC